MHHKTDDRIRAHVFICMLAYCLLRHLIARLEPLWEQQREELARSMREPKERDLTVHNVLEQLKSIRRNEVSMSGVNCQRVTQCNAGQQQILDRLGVTI